MPQTKPQTSKLLTLLSIAFLSLAIGSVSYMQQHDWQVFGISLVKSHAPVPLPTFKVKPEAWPLRQGPQVDVTEVQAAALVLIDEDSGTIIASRNLDQRKPMASITKMMTAALALEFADPDSQVIIPKAAFDGLPEDSAYMGVTAGETYAMKELLYGMMLTSGNEAANAVALAVAGSQPQFVALMNGKAQQLRLKNTHFANPSGLDDSQLYSSARDLAILAHYDRSFPLFKQIVASPTYEITATEKHKYLLVENLNPFLQTYPGATGIKPGNTGEAGNCLVASAERNGHHLIGVLLDTPGRNTNMAKLFDIGFENMK